MTGSRVSAVVLAVAIVLVAGVPPASAVNNVGSGMDPSKVKFGPRTALPRATCHPGDRPETDLQGRISPLDLAGGLQALGSGLDLGYKCNVELLGRFALPGGGAMDSYRDCAYYGRGVAAGGTQVLDVSDPAHPVATDMLFSRAMQDPWESLRVNEKRKLLVADSNFNTFLDIYDVSGDCRHPKLLSSTDMAPAQGHEGWFSPDGLTYYMSRTGPTGTATLFPVDISDPKKPRRLASWALETQTHGGYTTEDGNTSYVCQQQPPPLDSLLVMDTSNITARAADPKPVVRTRIGLEDNQWCQAALRVTYRGHPFLIQYGERSGATDCSRAADNWATFGYPRFYDLADDRSPKLISTAMLESALPQSCSEVTGEGAFNGLGYSVHHCSVDRLYDPTIMACSWFMAGMRVLDIRDPYHPVELAYYNPGIGIIVGTAPRPIIRAERREIWFANDAAGFYVVKLRDGIWPFAGSARCPEFDDYYYAQYNPGSTCPTANLNGIGKAPPGKVGRTTSRLTRLSAKASAGRKGTLRFTASRAVRVTIEVRRGARVVSRRSANVRAGRTTLRLPAVRAGRYEVVVRALGGTTHRLRLVVRATK